MAADGQIVAKYGVICEKAGQSRYFSHHDMMRFWERAIRRAGLPIRMTGGFNPRPRMVFPRPLPLGVASACEMVELEFVKSVEREELLDSLRPFMLGGMLLRRAVPMPARKKGHVIAATHYRLEGPQGSGAVLAEAAARFLELTTLPCARTGKDGDKTVDIRASVTGMVPDGDGVLFRVDERAPGSAKPFELLRWFASGCGLPEGGLSVRVTDAAFALDKD